jgi:hypothetical protein
MLIPKCVKLPSDAQQCDFQTSCLLAAECRNSLNANGLSVDLSQLPRCGFKGNFPKLCCPQLGMAPFRGTSATTSTPRPSSTTNRAYTSTARPQSYTTQRASSARPTTAAPNRNQYATSTTTRTTTRSQYSNLKPSSTSTTQPPVRRPAPM